MDRICCIVCSNVNPLAEGELRPLCLCCGYRAETSHEIGIAEVFSTRHKRNDDSILSLSMHFMKSIVEGRDIRSSFVALSDDYAFKYLRDPSPRDSETLKRKAGRGEVNLHIASPDGVFSETARRQSDIPAELFDAIKNTGGDAFLVESYEQGQNQSVLVSKPAWYASVDLFRLIELEAFGYPGPLGERVRLLRDVSRGRTEMFIQKQMARG